MNPDGTPITPPADPPADTTPAWAQSLIDQNADMASRLSAFEEKLQPPEPPAPEPEPTPDAWKPNSWDDVASRIDQTAAEKAQAIIDERDATAKATQEQQTAAAQEVDQFLDSQVAELTKANQLPAITNENDPNDPGKLAQRELYGFALSLGTADLKTSYNTLDALHKAGKQFDFVKMEIVDKNPASAGMNSPVGSSSGGASGTSSRPDYKTLQNLSIEQLAHRFGQ